MGTVNPLGVFRIKSRPKFLFVFATGALVLSLGGVLAANITLNGDATPNQLVFGQGVVQATSCDDQVTLVPKAHYVNSESKFYMDSLAIHGISSACLDKSFTVNGYSTGSDTPIPFSLTVGHPEISVYFKPADPANPTALPGTFVLSADHTATSLSGSWSLTTDSGNSATDNGFTLTFDPTNKIHASDLKTLTIETGN